MDVICGGGRYWRRHSFLGEVFSLFLGAVLLFGFVS